MKIAICVKDEGLSFFGNAGHTPKFALYEMIGSGMFKQFKLMEIIDNPRDDLDHEHADEDHQCSHDEGDEDHINQHFKMGEKLSGVDYLIAKRACKNTAKAMNKYNVKIKKYDGDALKAPQILAELSF